MLAEHLRDISGLGGLPVFVAAAVISYRLGEGTLPAMWAAGLSVGYLLAWAMRLAYFRPRPEPQAYATRLQRLDSNSFPSIHTMRSAVFWALLALHLRDNLVSAVAAVAILLVSLSRVWLRRHHPLDAAVGAILGVSVALAVAALWP